MQNISKWLDDNFKVLNFQTTFEILQNASQISKVISQKPTMFVVAGANASGKSTALANLYKAKILQLPYLNADIVVKTKLSNVVDEIERNKEAMFWTMQQVQNCIEQKQSFCYETVLSHPSKIQLVQQAKQNGFEVVALWVSTQNVEINLERLAKRVSEGGHNVPKEKMLQRFERSKLLSQELQKIADNFMIFENSQQK